MAANLGFSLNQLANHVWKIAANHGWHDSPNRIGDMCANMHGEVSELWEAYRNGRLKAPCDKAKDLAIPLTCAEEELADIIIRALDTATELRIDIARAISVKSEYNERRPHRHGGKLA